MDEWQEITNGHAVWRRQFWYKVNGTVLSPWHLLLLLLLLLLGGVDCRAALGSTMRVRAGSRGSRIAHKLQ